MDQNNVGAVNPLQPQQPTQPVSPVSPAPVPPAPAATAPVQPPASQSASQLPPQPAASGSMPEIPTPVNPVFNPTGAAPSVGTMSATEAIMQPTPPPAPDPVEEELKAPLKPAAPVPGSIGSAVSVPADAVPGDALGDGKTVPSVAFNDPAVMPDANAAQPAGVLPQKKKMEKKTLIAIAVIGIMVVVALAVILFVLMSNNG